MSARSASPRSRPRTTRPHTNRSARKPTRRQVHLALNLVPPLPAAAASELDDTPQPGAQPVPVSAPPVEVGARHAARAAELENLLIEEARRGLGAFIELARQHRSYLLRTARAILRNPDDAEDAVQDSLIVAWMNLLHYHPPRGGFQSWLTGIVRTRCKMILRERQRTSALSLDDVQRVAEIVDAQALLEQREQLTFLARAIQDLPRLQREAIQLRAAGRSTKDISFALGITPHAVTMNISRARRALREGLNAEGYMVAG